MNRLVFVSPVLALLPGFALAQGAKDEAKALLEKEIQRQVEERAGALRIQEGLAEAEDVLTGLSSFETLQKNTATTLEDLLSSDEGKKIAAHPPALTAFRREKERFAEHAPSEPTLDTWKKAVTAYRDALKEASTKKPLLLPLDPTEIGKLHRIQGLLSEKQATLSQIQSVLQGLPALASNPSVPDLSKARTLRDEIQRLDAAEAKALAEAIHAATEEAKEEGRTLLVDVAKLTATEDAKAEAEKERNEAREELRRQKERWAIDDREREQKHKEETDALKRDLEAKNAELLEKNLSFDAEVKRRVDETERRHQDELQRIQEERDLFEAELKARGIEVDLKKDRILRDAEKKLLIAKCQTGEVKTRLALFLEPGFWNPGTAGRSTTPKPMSFAAINACGALERDHNGEPTAKALKTLAEILSQPDKARDGLTWKSPRGWNTNPDKLRQLGEIQALLIELGPTLVELKMLAP